MNIKKQACCSGAAQPDQVQMEQINRLSRKKLSAEEVYTFAVRLCDNEVDRDGERFERGTLEGLAHLFVGKAGIFDHDWTAAGQTARLYHTEVVEEPGVVTAAGDGYCYIKGYAYVLRTPGNEELIAQLDGGILREVSVGCAVERSVCSVCGAAVGSCAHRKGEHYDGKLCYTSLEGAADAFEWSFVAVPAQPRAGVMKRMQTGGLKQAAQKEGCEYELEQLEREAAMGRRYMAGLRDEVVRLCGLSGDDINHGVMEGITQKLEEKELLELKRVYGRRAADRLPLITQLDHSEHGGCEAIPGDAAFLI